MKRPLDLVADIGVGLEALAGGDSLSAAAALLLWQASDGLVLALSSKCS